MRTKQITPVTVEIDRSRNTTVTAAVFPHEVDILRAIHGDVNVRPYQGKKQYPVEVPDSAPQEFARLCNRYDGRNAEDKFVHRVYLSPQALAAVTGLAMQDDGTGAPLQSLQVDAREEAERAKAEALAAAEAEAAAAGAGGKSKQKAA
jgi:hypothetical protein